MTGRSLLKRDGVRDECLVLPGELNETQQSRVDLAARRTEVKNPGPREPGSYSFAGVGLLSFVAHPPLPLQEFLPLQPLSPLLHPPWPLQALAPLQECLSLSVALLSAITPGAIEPLAGAKELAA